MTCKAVRAQQQSATDVVIMGMGRTLVAGIFLVVGVALTLLGAITWRASVQTPLFNTAPLDIPIQLKPETHARAPFTIERHETYDVIVEFATPRPFARFNELEAEADQIDMVWQVLRDGQRMASGRSMRRTWFHAGDMTGKNVGEFAAEPGTYIIEATILGVPDSLTGIDSRFAVLLNRNSMTNLGYTIELLPYLRYVGGALALLGLSALICGWRFARSAAPN